MESKKNYKVMLYQHSQMVWGNLAINTNISPIHYLHNPQQLSFISLQNAKVVSFNQQTSMKPIHYKEIHLPFKTLLASHFLPPTIETYDTGSDVEQSKNVEIDITVGDFIFRGQLVFSNQLSLIEYIKRQSSDYLTLAEVKIIHQTRKEMKKIVAPYAFIRISEAVFGLH